MIRSALKKTAAAILFSSLPAIASCINLTVSQTKEYDTMMHKAKSSLNLFSGNYADIISKHLGGYGLSDTTEEGAVPDYLDILKKYRFELNQRGSYYVLKIVDNRTWRLFDYTCTLEIGSTVFLTPGRFNLNDVGLYDSCVRR